MSTLFEFRPENASSMQKKGQDSNQKAADPTEPNNGALQSNFINGINK
jgi:hypothetical protein